MHKFMHNSATLRENLRFKLVGGYSRKKVQFFTDSRDKTLKLLVKLLNSTGSIKHNVFGFIDIILCHGNKTLWILHLQC